MIMKTVLARPVLWRKEEDKIKKFTVYYAESVIYALINRCICIFMVFWISIIMNIDNYYIFLIK